MFDSKDFDFDSDEFFKKSREEFDKKFEDLNRHHGHSHGGSTDIPVMEIFIGLVCVVGIAIILGLICRCCCGSSHRGRVLQPPAANSSVPAPPGPAPYPQQQYSTVTVPAATIISVGHPNMAPAPYPTSTHYPTAAPYPAAAQYPAGGSPYPAGGAPYPTGGAPYPAGGYSQMPQPSAVPSAPDAHALPPSYDQVMSSADTKQPPYNPYAPH